jgi:hypothetical protein
MQKHDNVAGTVDQKIRSSNRIALSKYDFPHRLPPVYLDFDPMQLKFSQRSRADLERHQKGIESRVVLAFLPRSAPLAPRLR